MGEPQVKNIGSSFLQYSESFSWSNFEPDEIFIHKWHDVRRLNNIRSAGAFMSYHPVVL